MSAEETGGAQQAEAQAQESEPVDVFISCTPQDRALGASMRRALGSFGVTSWLHPPRGDRAEEEGEGQAEEAEGTLSRAQVLVIVFSDHAITCPRVRREAERAEACGLAIISFRTADVPVPPWMEPWLATAHWLDALDGPPHAHLHLLCEEVRRLLLAAQRTRQAQAEPSLRQPEAFWTPEDLEQLERMMAAYLGPVAKILVREALQLSTSRPVLARRLARHIDREGERQAFLASCRRAGLLSDASAAGLSPSAPSAAAGASIFALLPSGSGCSADEGGLGGANRLWPWKKGT